MRIKITKNLIKDYFIDVGILTILIFVLWLIWSGLELLFYKEIQPRHVDDIISLITIYPYWRLIKNKLNKEAIK